MSEPAATKSLFWYGCNMTRHAEIIRLSERMLRAVGVEAAPVGGPGACCGNPKESTPRVSEAMGDRTMAGFNATGAPRVITWCPSCHMNLDDFMGQTNDRNFDSRHLCEALHERRDALAPLLTHPVKARFLVDRHVGFNGRVPVNELIPELLSMIPGASFVDHAYRAPSYMCFSLAPIPGALADVQRATLAAMRETGADTLVTIFHSCHREMIGLERDHGIRVVNWVHLLAEAMGIPYEDEYKAWRNAEDPLAAIGPERVAAAGEVAVRKLVLPELTRPPVI
ncbi:heterodisulfide reductase-related iron-sulfur binding cluster [Roseococcus sp.]|uniref:heterodisulfide reductase-related iron-sulfur binding cluster n=1 Tax=Roseococcus sp. TaxID=2109646 RepID=UPI003BACF257